MILILYIYDILDPFFNRKLLDSINLNSLIKTYSYKPTFAFGLFELKRMLVKAEINV